MSQLWTPPGSKKPEHPLGVDRHKEKMRSQIEAHDVKELYPDEFNELKIIMAQVQGKYSAKYATEDVQAQMSREIQHRLAEELGLLCAIEWTPTDVVQMDGETRPVLTPSVTVTGRTTEVEIDHDRIKQEVQQGYMDGQVGSIDEHGNWKE